MMMTSSILFASSIAAARQAELRAEAHRTKMVPRLLVSCAMMGLLLLPALAAGAARPNVLMVAVDDLRPDIAGPAFEQREVITPNLQRLAAAGVAFERAYCQVALCSPSRTVLLTGLRPDTTKVWSIGPYFRHTSSAGSAVVTLPQRFREVLCCLLFSLLPRLLFLTPRWMSSTGRFLHDRRWKGISPRIIVRRPLSWRGGWRRRLAVRDKRVLVAPLLLLRPVLQRHAAEPRNAAVAGSPRGPGWLCPK